MHRKINFFVSNVHKRTFGDFLRILSNLVFTFAVRFAKMTLKKGWFFERYSK